MDAFDGHDDGSFPDFFLQFGFDLGLQGARQRGNVDQVLGEGFRVSGEEL